MDDSRIVDLYLERNEEAIEKISTNFTGYELIYDEPGEGVPENEDGLENEEPGIVIEYTTETAVSPASGEEAAEE